MGGCAPVKGLGLTNVNTLLRPGARFSKTPRLFRARKSNSKSLLLKSKRILTLHNCKLCLNEKPVEIKSSLHRALHGL